MKKGLIILAAVMLLSIALAGCSGSAGRADAPDSETETGGAAEPYNVVISVFYVGTVPKDLELVEEAINKITVDAIDCTVTLLPISASEASAKFSLWVSNGEKIDLMSSFPLDLGTCIANNSVVQLDDLLAEHAPYISSLDKRYLGSKYNGGIYGIPVMQRTYGAVGGIVVRNDIMKEVGLNYTEEDIVDYEDLDAMFALVHEKYPEMITYGFGGTLLGTAAGYFIPVESFSVAGMGAGVLMNGGVDTTEIVNLFETDEYREYLDWMRRWNQAGYISPDAATTTDASEWLKAGRAFSSANSIAEPGASESSSQSCGRDVTVLYQQEPMVKSDTYSAAPWIIPITSERPEKALEFLDFMYESKEVANLIQYGIEGVHYDMTDEDMIIKLREDRAYTNLFGLYGNKMNVYMVAPNKSSVYEESAAFSERALERTSTAAGYRFVPENVTAELAAISNVMGEYIASLEYGFVDVDTVLPQFNQALKNAGIDKVIAENQKQFDEWLKTQE